ncbi:hypothetical protein ACO34A_09205 [Rhizobium sp. ACO-34A]|nr:hypothetical protein [Rhizobium sp. ACO-34A]ATN33985.1 hypothetical protein ACO34A_09205 [Rhizobium sp. ACO-34A]
MDPDLGTIPLTDRPLVVCDVDDVVLEFVTPFGAFLESRGHRLIPRSFRLHGNIVNAADESILETDTVTSLIETFFAVQEEWQTPFAEAIEALGGISQEADLVFLTAMPPKHAAARRRLLDRFGLRYPMIAADQAKGPLVNRLHGGRSLPVAFIDDMVSNLHSVGEHVPECLLVHLPPPVEIHKFAPAAGDHVRKAQGWAEARALIGAHITG